MTLKNAFPLLLTIMSVVSCTPKAAERVPEEEPAGPSIDFSAFVSNTFHSEAQHDFLGVVSEGQDIYFSLEEDAASLQMSIFTDQPIMHAVLPKSQFLFFTEEGSDRLSYKNGQMEFHLSHSGSLNVYFGASHKFENPWDDLTFTDKGEKRAMPAGDAILQNDQYQTAAILKVIAGKLPTNEEMQYGDIPDYFHRLPLDYAIRSSQKALYAPLLITNTSKDNRPQSDQALLQVCLDNRDYEGLKFLLSNGYDPYASNPTGSEINNYPLIASLNDVKALSIFLDSIDVEMKFMSYRTWYKGLPFSTPNDQDGTLVTTLLGFAVLSGKKDASAALLARGARSDAAVEFSPFGEDARTTSKISDVMN